MPQALTRSIEDELAPIRDAEPAVRPVAPAAYPSRPEADLGGPAFATLEIHRDFAEVEPLWRAVMAEGLAGPYQNPAFLEAWADHVGPCEGVRPLIVVARDADGRPIAVLPFCTRRRAGVRVAGFMGGSHSNFNMPVIRRDALARLTPDETRRLLRETAALGRIDVFVLTNQPFEWDGVRNPLAALPRQPSPDAGFSGQLGPDPETHFRSTMSSKTRSKRRRNLKHMQELGTVRIFKGETSAEKQRLLDAYFAQKGEQLARRGVRDVFKKAGVTDFLAAAAGVDGQPPAVDFYGLEYKGDIIAVTAALPHGDRYSCMLNSISDGDHAKFSPGKLLVDFVVEGAIRRGFKVFDLGVGAALYKTTYCPDAEQLFDTMFGVTPVGRAAAGAASSLRSAKARIKANPRAYGAIKSARARWARLRGVEPAGAEHAED